MVFTLPSEVNAIALLNPRTVYDALMSAAAQTLADDLVEVGVKVIFNYSEALLQVPPEVTVHTSSPAVDLLYALYFYLT